MVLWTNEHLKTLLPGIIIMILISVVLRLTLGKKSLKIRRIPFQITACTIAALEIAKQIMSIRRGYDLYHLPFHFCSMLIFLPMIMSFYRGKHEKTMSAITTAVTAAIFLLTSIYPNLIYSADNIQLFTKDFFSFHTVAFHNVAMLMFLLIPALNLHQPAPKGETLKVILFIVGFCVISASMAHLLKTNFNNFYTCNIAPLETVRQSVEASLGTAVAAIFYVLVVTVMDILFVTGSYWFYRLLYRIFNKKARAD